MATGFSLLDNPNPNGPNFYTSRNTDLRIGVVHTAENLPYFQDGPDRGAENVSTYASTTSRGVSWHDTVDSDSRVMNLPYSHTAWHVVGYNSPSVGLEIATQAHRWDEAPDEWIEGVVEQTALVFVDWYEAGIPLRLITREQVDRGERGITYHAYLDPERRSDPGEGMPIERMLERARELVGKDPSPGFPEGPSEWARSLPLIKRGDKNYHVGVAQGLLFARQVEIPNSVKTNRTPDRDFGGGTEDAIRSFQSTRGLSVDGVVGPETWHRLLAGIRTETISDETESDFRVRQAQALVSNAGFPPANTLSPSGIPDGDWGRQTDRSVRRYQHRKRITVDGVVGVETLSNLFLLV